MSVWCDSVQHLTYEHQIPRGYFFLQMVDNIRLPNKWQISTHPHWPALSWQWMLLQQCTTKLSHKFGKRSARSIIHLLKSIVPGRKMGNNRAVDKKAGANGSQTANTFFKHQPINGYFAKLSNNTLQKSWYRIHLLPTRTHRTDWIFNWTTLLSEWKLFSDLQDLCKAWHMLFRNSIHATMSLSLRVTTRGSSCSLDDTHIQPDAAATIHALQSITPHPY